MDAATFALVLRWAHFLAGVVWVGHNYSSVVQRPTYVPLQASDLIGDTSARFQSMLNREHGIFRWASVVTWSAGLLMLWQRGALPAALHLQGGQAPIGIGMYIGTLMMLNVWFVLWPHQKKVLGLVPAPVEERLRCSRITHLSSRTNTMLSVPLLFFMAAGAHGGLPLA
ncbi:urate hydroxylase PuuD [Duganella sp. LX20W]|uniref:Urate hydroxylase PuuD n=1 Tax=Rugamonas brunnea TaxID=2758569 RepID=A0A7W2EVB7_9BURK|nr:urate hydroxylase PuuD [Rugamonas brunnea]MBA5639303.1 urate hydroxylase PuuD [Rugamonas brunnea]